MPDETSTATATTPVHATDAPIPAWEAGPPAGFGDDDVEREAIEAADRPPAGHGDQVAASASERMTAAVVASVPTPTAEHPLRGLVHLAKVAVVGAKATHALANAPILWVWDGVAIVGLIVVIAGKVGCGKTTLLFWILAARANAGAPILVLGREVTPARVGAYVVLIEGEHGEASTARKLVRLLRAAGVVDVDAALDRMIFVARKSVCIGSPEWQDVERLIAAGLVSDIALDTLARVAPGDANDERDQIAIFDRVAQAIDRAPSAETKPLVWCAAHLRKGEGGDLDDVSGSAQRTGQADTVLFVVAERREGQVTSSKVTFQKLREEPDEYPAPVEFTVTRESIVIVGAAEKDDRPLEARIVDRLRVGPLTKNGLRDKLGSRDTLIEEALSTLFSERRIERTTVRVRGVERRAFSLRADQ